ncbi:MAG: hypothetical protein ABEK03_02780 [Candidatus Bipolaricaulia bacterium]
MIVLRDLVRLLIAGTFVVVGLLVAVGVLKLAVVLMGLLVPVLFGVGALYLGYRWWQRYGPRVTGRRTRW